MLTKEFTVTNAVGLHARPASVLTQLAGKYESEIFIKKANAQVNVKSILSLLSLGARKGDKIVIEVQGSDEEAALEAVIGYLASLGDND
ncbi:MAG: HPr family phosphocarrier protein [Clostridiales bacterium]